MIEDHVGLEADVDGAVVEPLPVYSPRHAPHPAGGARYSSAPTSQGAVRVWASMSSVKLPDRSWPRPGVGAGLQVQVHGAGRGRGELAGDQPVDQVAGAAEVVRRGVRGDAVVAREGAAVEEVAAEADPRAFTIESTFVAVALLPAPTWIPSPPLAILRVRKIVQFWMLTFVALTSMPSSSKS